MVAVQKADIKVSFSSQTASLKTATFDGLTREYVERQGRSLTLFRLKLNPPEVLRIKQLVEGMEAERLPYKYLSRNCTHYCVDFVSHALVASKSDIHSKLYLTPRSGLQHILSKIGSDRVMSVRWNPKLRLTEETEYRGEIDDYEPIQISGIGPMISVGAGITNGNTFSSITLRPGVHDLISGELDDFTSKMLFAEVNLELGQQCRTALTLFDFEVFRNATIQNPELSKLFRVGFDERTSFNDIQRGFYAKYALLLSKGNDRLFRIAAGPEIYLSSRDCLNLRAVVCTRFVLQRSVFIDSRLALQDMGRPVYETNILLPIVGDFRFRIETRVGQKQWSAGISVGYFFD
jgi:hypothetical protein